MKAKELLEILKGYSENFLEKAEVKIQNNEIEPADVFGITAGEGEKYAELGIYTTELFPRRRTI